MLMIQHWGVFGASPLFWNLARRKHLALTLRTVDWLRLACRFLTQSRPTGNYDRRNRHIALPPQVGTAFKCATSSSKRWFYDVSHAGTLSFGDELSCDLFEFWIGESDIDMQLGSIRSDSEVGLNLLVSFYSRKVLHVNMKLDSLSLLTNLLLASLL